MAEGRAASMSIAQIRPHALNEIERRYFRPAEVMALTGATKSHVMAAIYAGRLTAHQVGRAWFVPAECVDQWIRGEAA